tara:strand:+ start:240 stop:629 length:390 start_codon:yes stop_codon:yes gene_type:complete
MNEKFKIEVITPNKTILKTDAIEVVIPSYEGETGILKDHISLITFLRPGLIKIKNETEKTYFVEEGIVEFNNNNLLILTSTAKELESINKKEKDFLINDAERIFNDLKSTDKEKYISSYKIETLKNINQ